MSQGTPFLESTLIEQDETFELPLRPRSLDDFVGQPQVRDRLHVLIQAAKNRGEPLGHCIFCGPPGLGKTTLSHIIAHSMDSNLVAVSGPVIEKAGDLAGILTNLQEGDVLFIDEIHRLNRTVEEYLYPAMEDFKLDLLIDTGPNARSVQVKLNHFTLVGATTRMGSLSSPLRTRFGFSCRLDYYCPEVLAKIVMRTAKLLDFKLDQQSALEIGKRSRGTPRIANNLLRWVRDYSQVHGGGKVSVDIVDKALNMLTIDHRGLDEMDKRILELMIGHYDGGPVGLGTLSVALGEEKETVEEVYEPYLILQGFIKRTLRGREVTAQAYEHLGIVPPEKFSESNTGDA